MYKIEFFKDNKKVEINSEEITYDLQLKIIQKENTDTIIILDFKNKKCDLLLKESNTKFTIPVINMSDKTINNKQIFEYKLESEPDIINSIIIEKKHS